MRAMLTALALAAPAAARAASLEPPGTPPGAAGWFELDVPSGTAELARAAGLDPATEAWRLLPDLTRRLHASYGERVAPRAAPQVLAALTSGSRAAPAGSPARDVAPPPAPPPPAGDDGDGDGDGTVLFVPAGPSAAAPPLGPAAIADRVPIPLAPSLWDHVLGRDKEGRARDVLIAITTDGNAGRLYRGLVTLDAPTLAALAAEPDVLREIYRRHSDAFSAFAGSFRVEGGRVAVPGGHPEAALWQEVVGASVLRPGEFLLRLASADQGRLFFLYDAAARLDDAHRRFALDAPERDAERRLERVRALKVLFALGAPWWDASTAPFSRPVADAPRVLEAARVGADGTLAAPNRQLLWAAAFDDQVDAPADWRARLAQSPLSDAAWLAEKIAGAAPSVSRSRLGLLSFGQRLFGDAPDADPALILAALRGFGRYRALALSLERMGIADPGVHAAAARRAEQLEQAGHGERARDRLAEFQGVLALVEHAAQATTLDPAGAAALVRSAAAVDLDEGRYADRLASWIAAELLPALRARLALPASTGAEATVLRAMAGLRDTSPRVRLEWEGLAYDVDPAAAEYARLRAVRRRQGGDALDDVLAGPAAGREARLATVLIDLAYAAALGPAEGAPAASEDVARRHEFGLGEPQAPGSPRAGWGVPHEVAGPGQRWHAQGALLGLDVGLARLALRRLDTDVPPMPALSAADRRAFAEGAVLVREAALDDAGRDAIAEALAEGRARLAGAAADPHRLAAVAVDLGLRDWRRGLLPWIAAHDPEHLESALTLGEVFRLGAPEGAAHALAAWGASARGDDGCLCPDLRRPASLDALAGHAADGRMAALAPDLHLRVAELLAARRLPASLAPAILSLAVQDLMDQARPAFLDDMLGISRFARALDGRRMDDYVAALVGRGPLRPRAEP